VVIEEGKTVINNLWNIVKIETKVPLSYPTATFGVPLGTWDHLPIFLRSVYRIVELVQNLHVLELID